MEGDIRVKEKIRTPSGVVLLAVGLDYHIGVLDRFRKTDNMMANENLMS